MVNERSSLTKVVGKTKQILRYGATSGDHESFEYTSFGGKRKYSKIRFLKKLWTWNFSSKNDHKEIMPLEDDIPIPQKQVTVATYALCFIMMLAGLSVKKN